MIYRFYRKTDCILYLLINLVLILIEIVWFTSCLDIYLKLDYFVGFFPLQLFLIIAFIQYYRNKDSVIIFDNTLKIRMNKQDYEFVYNDIKSVSMNIVLVIRIRTNNKFIDFQLPISLRHKIFEILNLIAEKSNLKEKKKHFGLFIRNFVKED